jgi:pyruvate,water dikinase
VASDPDLRDAFERCDAEVLAAEYLAGRLPGIAPQAVGDFLRRYGMRGVAEIDIGRRRWHDDPTYIFQVLKSYLQIGDPYASPEAVFARGAEKAHAAGESLVADFRRTKRGWLKARVAGLMIRRVRKLTGLRETPKFAMIRIFGILREALLAGGERLSGQGVFEQPDDIFFLYSSELKEPELPGAAARIAQRRQVYQREKARRQIPRLMLSDGTAFYDGALAADSDTVLTGAPVSAGTVEGIVHVVFDPRNAQLAPRNSGLPALIRPGRPSSWRQAGW